MIEHDAGFAGGGTGGAGGGGAGGGTAHTALPGVHWFGPESFGSKTQPVPEHLYRPVRVGVGGGASSLMSPDDDGVEVFAFASATLAEIVKLVHNGKLASAVTPNWRVLLELAGIDAPAGVNAELANRTVPHDDDPARKLISQALNVAATPPVSLTVTITT